MKIKKHVLRVVVPVAIAALVVVAVAVAWLDSYLSLGVPYVDAEHGFAMNPPRGWTVGNGTQDVLVFFHAPSNLAAISVVADSSSGYDLEKYVNQTKSDAAWMYDSYALLGESRGMLSGAASHEIVAAFKMRGVSYKERQIISFRNNEAYIITFVASASVYDMFTAPFEKSAGSFRFLY